MLKHTLGEAGTKQSFDGKLCREYLYQKFSKSDNRFSSYSRKCWRCLFETQCTYIFPWGRGKAGWTSRRGCRSSPWQSPEAPWRTNEGH